MSNAHWPKAIVFIDMNAFFASIEQLDFPELRARPIVVTNGLTGTGIITCSYEARAYGIQTCMRLKEAKKRCPHVIQRPARPERYAQVSKAIMRALGQITPDIEVFSVDEAFLDVTHCQNLWGIPETIGRLAKQAVWQASGLHCSVGVSGDKTTAKLAGKQVKPNGLTIVPPQKAEAFLANKAVDELCGIGNGIKRFLNQYGVFVCGDMKKIPMSILTQRFGNPGRRIWYMAQGKDFAPVEQDLPCAKSMGHGKVMPPNTKEKQIILTYICHMAEKLSARLRRHQMQAKNFVFRLRSHDGTGIKAKFQTTMPTDDGLELSQHCRAILERHSDDEGYFQIHLQALDPMPADGQIDLFLEEDHQKKKVNALTDQINQRFGEFTLFPTRLITRSDMPNVISPAWKPFGHRDTIK